MALAFCMSRWATENKQSIHVFVVDHRLRVESKNEAAQTQQRLAGLGLKSEILSWDHGPVVTRLHVSARKARYRLLIEACKQRGINKLFLAHQKEDQAETILMRFAKGSGVDGLAGMRAQSVMGNVQLLRPFLNISKTRLIATCREAGLEFIEDASNRSEKFARGRLRKVMPLLEQEGLTIDRLIDLGERAAEAKEALDFYTHEFLREKSQRDKAGVIRFDLSDFKNLPRAIAGRALTMVLQEINKADYAPEHMSLVQLMDALCADGDMSVRTLHGCLISRTENQITIMREFAAITDAPTIKAGESIIWDGRWKVTITDAKESFTIRPLGNPPHEAVDARAPGLRKAVPQGRARASMPSIWQGECLVLVPSLDDSGTARAQLVTTWPPG